MRLTRNLRDIQETVTIMRRSPETNEYIDTLTNLKIIIQPRTTSSIDEDGAILLDSNYKGVITPPIANIDQIQPDDLLVRTNQNNRQEQKLFIIDITNIAGIQELILSSQEGSPAQ